MFVSAFVTSLLLAAAADGAPTAIQPTGKWVVDWSDARCTAQIPFGEKDDQQFVLIKASPLGETHHLYFIRNGKMRTATQYEARLTIGDQPSELVTSLTYGNDKRIIELVNLSKAQSEKLRTSYTVSLGHFGKSKTYALPNFPKVVAALEKCQKDLAASWNWTGSKVQTHANGNLLDVFKSNDYPAQANMNNMSGIVTLAILVDEKGKVADCTVEQPSGVAVLDAQSCALVTVRAKFEPARDQAGTAIKDTLVQRINWRSGERGRSR